MDQTTASYYRCILFGHGENSTPLPASLVAMHSWSSKKLGAMGLNGVIPKHAALMVVLSWISMTKDGRAFASSQPDLQNIVLQLTSNDKKTVDTDACSQWDSVTPETSVTVMVGTEAVQGVFVGRTRGRTNCLTVRIGDETKVVKATDVQVAK